MNTEKCQKVWSEYNKLRDYLAVHNVYDQVKLNERFYSGKQWEGVDAPDIAKPVMNELARIGNYQIAALSSKGIGISILPFYKEDREVADAISKSVENVIEHAKLEESSRIVIRDGFVDGACYSFLNFNENEKFKGYDGMIEEELLDMTQVYFGNPFTHRIQSQPYIILSFRQHIQQVKEEAKQRGLTEDEIDDIKTDNDSDIYNDETNDRLCTVLIKLWRENGTVHFSKSTKNVFLVEDIDLDYKRYPLARFGWNREKNSFLYTSPISENINNQIFINKTFAYADEYLLKGAFPKMIFDSSKIMFEDLMGEGMSAINVASLDILGKLFDFSKAPELPAQLTNFINLTIKEMRNTMGINDAALGEVQPNNTSAIIALQEAANAPLELQRQEFYEFWEDRVRNIIDIMSARYGSRLVALQVDGQDILFEMDFDKIKDINYDLKIDIGSGSQYSEIAQISTLDNLLTSGQITLEDYLEAIPDKLIPKKNVLLERVKARMKQMQQQPINQ